jgi:hypothetical protein
VPEPCAILLTGEQPSMSNSSKTGKDVDARDKRRPDDCDAGRMIALRAAEITTHTTSSV